MSTPSFKSQPIPPHRTPTLGELSGSCDHDGGPRSPALTSDGLDGLHDVHALDNASENAVLAVKPCRLRGAQKELGTIGVRPSIGHGPEGSWMDFPPVPVEFANVKQTLASNQSIVMIFKLTVVVGEVTSLAHEARNDSMERRALESESLLS
ncbi:hypothetical protein THAOC_32645 [Thalassiosira oceanica]|uniref:Uncharacterized protein n=1 Tax=Thalassiosira oceanica TaxID=159749 RepID=K0R6P9_THAOC|nr:hypothetical protein THAOC_32645 [Thalassiosira oceanica]|eukprot:EJK48545.1 hypothetical protein THAOC_32645 [Thalassiosira oceanica]